MKYQIDDVATNAMIMKYLHQGVNNQNLLASALQMLLRNSFIQLSIVS